jgi:orotate phosphoribosyltransferase-like protein
MTEADRIRAGKKSLKGDDKVLYELIKAIVNEADIAAALGNSPLGDNEYYQEAFLIYEMIKRGTNEEELHAHISQYESSIDEEDLDIYWSNIAVATERLAYLAKVAAPLEIAAV